MRFNAYNKLNENTAGVTIDEWFEGQKITNYLFAKNMMIIPPSEQRLAQLKGICDYE